ncbi:hypothetical protein CVS40_6396 [Lucilia cuprina]|nr:hypothetical protein CVS40_6396 [Lucilia cuprina]
MDNSLRRILVGSIYIPCNISTSRLNDGLDKLLQTAGNFDGFILGGDLNARHPNWGDPLENCNGRVLNNWLLDHFLDVSRICDAGPSTQMVRPI